MRLTQFCQGSKQRQGHTHEIEWHTATWLLCQAGASEYVYVLSLRPSRYYAWAGVEWVPVERVL